MPDSPPKIRRRNTFIAILILIIIAILLLLLTCRGKKPPTRTPKTTTQPTAPTQPIPSPGAPPPTSAAPVEKLTGATITAPSKTPAGSTFQLSWTGPDNKGDFITIVPRPSPHGTTGPYQETSRGTNLNLTAPNTPGLYELQYITAQSRTILGRAQIEVSPVTATITAPAEVTLGSDFTLTWTGPNAGAPNKGDYITIVDRSAPDSAYNSYAEPEKGATLTLTAPTTPGDYELRYVADPDGGDKKVLARRDIKVTAAAVSLQAPDSAIAGSTIPVSWTGPNNRGDYITIVEKSAPDATYGNYFDCNKPSPQSLLTPIAPTVPGDASTPPPIQPGDQNAGGYQVRYVTHDRRVLARRPITLTAPPITLSAPPEAKFDTHISITWTGPSYRGDYITIVEKSTPDGQYGPYTLTDKGSPLTIRVPKLQGNQERAPGDYEVRYMTGQGNKVLGRTPIKVVP